MAAQYRRGGAEWRAPVRPTGPHSPLTIAGADAHKTQRPMLFNSLEFAVFLILVLTIHHLAIPKTWWRGRKIFLVVASYVFYMSWNPFFGLLLLGSTLIDFVLGLTLERTTGLARRRALLCISL